MRIAVLLKQVPDTDEVKLDEEKGTMIREGIGTVINPLDLQAIEAGRQFIEQEGGTLSVFSMGPPQTEESLREAIAMGAHTATLITDRKFGGADTWATARVLSEVLKRNGPYDLILAGEKATDGETGQVGPEVAAMLGIPFSTYVSEIDKKNDGVIVKRTVEDGYETQFLPFPCLLTVLNNLNHPEMPTLSGKIRGHAAKLETVTASDLPIPEGELGLTGSPTRVSKVFYPKIQRKCEMYALSDIRKGIQRIVRELKNRAIL
ncbi:MAG TPA: electron transfer flavoprotein subunit beta/FixA family protein [Thermotogota bacterium]|nr:electron transfer flavoprotein subunit beta/FixA family protein [Thermotogota bacterium]